MRWSHCYSTPVRRPIRIAVSISLALAAGTAVNILVAASVPRRSTGIWAPLPGERRAPPRWAAAHLRAASLPVDMANGLHPRTGIRSTTWQTSDRTSMRFATEYIAGWPLPAWEGRMLTEFALPDGLLVDIRRSTISRPADPEPPGLGSSPDAGVWPGAPWLPGSHSAATPAPPAPPAWSGVLRLPVPASAPEWVPRMLPIIPVWPGALANSVLFAAALWGIPFGARRGWLAARTTRRRRAGRCVGCGYARGALLVCPECGREG